ncbi:replication restart helicase PriA [Flavihumibacter petaseus]|uniref:Replication restart protein PriA n=1 Tax=Flavihumibacter petaseus NBRC 106054 TaxID=1220578 RepID=A0A0E9N249_9BACT|nr:primosomal protein N' [Flavihumibacter petaseus]GAO43741.1 primosomal protein N' [Flavihumibacter petaseus NBRC 106054]
MNESLPFEPSPVLFAEVLIPLALPRNFTWALPPELQDKAMPGMRVEVVLGRNKKYAGIIKKLHDKKPAAFDPKPVLNLLDETPILHAQQLLFWEWMAHYYLCSEGEVMQAALPTHFKLSSETILLFNDAAGEDFSHLDDEEFVVAEALLIKKELRITEVQQLLDASHVYPVIQRLLEKKVCLVWEELKQTYKEKKETFILLHPQYNTDEKLADLLNNWTAKAPKQLELLLAYLHLEKTEGEVTKSALLSKSGASADQLKGLVSKAILLEEKRTVDRLKSLPANVSINFTLTPAQETALAQLQDQFSQKAVCLLQGVTSSGKTLLYIRLMEEALRNGKQVLYMLPEIALTAQVIRRLREHFGGHIVIYHSKFNANERVELWHKVKSGEAKIVLGARSSVFLPFRDLGLVIVDEEHDSSFKQQDPAPRYNGRDAAVFLASLYQAKVLLGSATPSLESWYNVKQGKYGLAQLTERYAGIDMPQIGIVDTTGLRQADKSRVILSPALEEAITQTLQKNKQVILFQNRRGYSPYQVCQSCGWIPHCKHCDVSLTFHKLHNKLVCHYCGTIYPPVVICEACGNHDFQQQNFGTERIEESLVERFPHAKVARMDIDAIKGKHAHDALIQLFEQQRIDILVGTQMVVKGLDFDHVQLVGILDADAIMGFADFRVNERAFQLMEQVSGRSGRKGEQGLVLVQTRNPRHPVLAWVKAHDFETFAQAEMSSRQQFGYPPFTRLIQLSFKHKTADVVQAAARQFAAWMTPNFGAYLVGPAAPVVNRVRNQYIMDLLIKLPRDLHLLQQCKDQIQLLTAHLHQQPPFKSVIVTPDIDPI